MMSPARTPRTPTSRTSPRRSRRSSRASRAWTWSTQAANLITYQNGYQAAARFVTVVSTLMSQLISTLGSAS